MNEQKCKIARRTFKYLLGADWKFAYKNWKKAMRKCH